MKDGIENRPELAQGAGAKPGWYGYYIRCERMKKNMEQLQEELHNQQIEMERQVKQWMKDSEI